MSDIVLYYDKSEPTFYDLLSKFPALLLLPFSTKYEFFSPSESADVAKVLVKKLNWLHSA